MRHISLKYAIVVAFLLVMAMPLWLAWTWPRNQAYLQEMNAVEERHLVIAKSIRTALGRYEADVSKIFNYFFEDINRAQGDGASAAQDLLGAFGFRHICEFQISDGTLLDSAALPGLPCPDYAPADKLQMFMENARTDRVTFSPVAVAPDGQPILFTMRRTDNTVTIAALSTAYFIELGEIIEFGELGHAAIVDHTGHALWHPNPAWLSPPKDMSEISIVQKMMQGGSGKDEFYSPAKQLDMVAGYATLQSTGWGVMVPQPTRELEAHADNIRKETTWILIAALGIATLLALLAAHVLLDPLRTIRSRAEELGTGAGGSLIAPMGLATRLTEFDDLRNSFNDMVLRVRSAQKTEIEARREAQEANRTKSRFLANMSHELRTPLNAIIGFAQITKRRLSEQHNDREREHEYLGYIDQSGKHLLSLIDDLLDLSKIEAGARVLKEEIMSVNEMLRDVHAMMSAAASEKQQQLYKILPDDKEVLVRADPVALRQMMINLATNAVRYTDEGGKISLAANIDEDDRLVLTVTDNGPGIPEEERLAVRRPFTRGKSFERSATPGAGLGLNIVDALSEMHGASLTLTSSQGVGTIARLTFPASRTASNTELVAKRATRNERAAERSDTA